MLLKSFTKSFRVNLDVLMIMFEVFLCGIGLKDKAKRFSTVPISEVYARLSNSGMLSSGDTEKLFMEYIRMMYGDEMLAKFYVYFKDWDPTKMVRYYIEADTARDALMSYFSKVFALRRKLSASESNAIYELFKETTTVGVIPDFIPRSFLPFLKHAMKVYFIPGKKVEISAILNSSGLNCVEEKNGESYSFGQFLSVPMSFNSKYNIDDLDFAEISKQIASVSEKNKCEAFFHGKSLPYAYYDVFSFLKWRDLQDYYNVVTENVPGSLLRNVSIADEGVRGFTYVPNYGGPEKYRMLELRSSSTLAEKKLEIRKAGLNVMYDYFTGKLSCDSIAKLYDRVYNTELLETGNKKDLSPTFESSLSKSEGYKSRAWQYYFDGFKAAFSLYWVLKSNKLNIFSVNSAAFTVPALIGKFEKLSDYLKFYKEHTALVLEQPNSDGAADNDTVYSTLVGEYKDAYAMTHNEALEFAKHIPLQELINVFYEEEPPMLEVKPSGLNASNVFNLSHIELVLTICGMILNLNTLDNAMGLVNPSELKGAQWNEKMYSLLLQMLSKELQGKSLYLTGIYTKVPGKEMLFETPLNTMGCEKALNVVLVSNKSLAPTLFSDMEPYEQTMCLARVFTFFYRVRFELLEIVYLVRNSKFDFELYEIWQEHRAFLDMLNHPNDLMMIENWYDDLREYYVTPMTSKSEILNVFRDLLKWFVSPEKAEDLVDDIAALMGVLNPILEKYRMVEEVTPLASVGYTSEMEKVKEVLLDVNKTYSNSLMSDEYDSATGLLLNAFGEIVRDVQGNEIWYHHASGATIAFSPGLQIAYLR